MAEYEVKEVIRDHGLELQYPPGSVMSDGELPEPLIRSLYDAGVIGKPSKAKKATARAKKADQEE